MCFSPLSVSLYNAVIGTRMHGTTTPPRNAGTYFNSIMFMVASSVVSTILILNYHHRNSDTHEMSEWVSKPSYTLCVENDERKYLHHDECAGVKERGEGVVVVVPETQ